MPIFTIFLTGDVKYGVPLSKATILGGAIGNFVSIGWARHPKANRPLIDYESSTLMQSGELLGVVFGVLANMILPRVYIILFLAVILTFNAYKTLNKGRQQFAKETAKKLAAAEEAAAKEKSVEMVDAPKADDDEDRKESELSDLVDDAPTPPAEEMPASDAPQAAACGLGCLACTEGGDDAPAADVEAAPSAAAEPEIEVAVEADAAKAVALDDEAGEAGEADKNDPDAVQFPLWAWKLLAPMTLFTIAYAIFKMLLLKPCSAGLGGAGLYWTWYFLPVPVLGGFMYATAKILVARHERRVAAGFQYLENDMQWTYEQLGKFPKVAVLAGVAAGLLGIGGGMVIGPLFLQIGMEPQVGTASCAFMILWTAASGVIQYMCAGKLAWKDVLCCVALGFCSGQIGQRGVNAMLRKFDRPSLITFLLGSVVAVACVTMTITGIVSVIDEFNDAGSNPWGKVFGGFDTSEFSCSDDDH